jgi:hypothetical protein
MLSLRSVKMLLSPSFLPLWLAFLIYIYIHSILSDMLVCCSAAIPGDPKRIYLKIAAESRTFMHYPMHALNSLG